MVTSSQIAAGNGVNGSNIMHAATTKPMFGRCFTQENKPVGSMFQWKKVDAVLKNAKGEETFRQDGVEAPEQWSERAIKIVAEKYLRVVDGVKEVSVMQLAHRVATFITEAGVKQNLFDTVADSEIFRDELLFLILDQRFAFNSPVWFNVGVNPDEKPQSSACFIQSVQDTMESIMDLEKKEVMLFKQGSGTGGNLSPLRSSYEKLRGGGFASGPVSYMKPLDKNAGVTKSGGTTRRAACMRVMNIDHPDILECRDGTPGFIRCKSFAEKVAQDLYSTGFYSAEFNVPSNVYDLVDFQNANNSVRCSDAFMQAVVRDEKWNTRLVTTGKPFHTYKARELWQEVAEAAWFCGDPGVQFDDTTNKWHTVPNSGRINASNPCSEFLHLDDSACNLGSWNLLKFWNAGSFDIIGFKEANRIAITAMEILVDASSYPSAQIGKNAHDFRPLGIGYANLGALLMHMGLGYDSEDGRAMTSAITSLMTGECYAQSALIAGKVGAFNGYALNTEPMLNVIDRHYKASQEIPYVIGSKVLGSLITAANDAWHRASSLGKEHGFRNAQISVIAPTGTISFMMDAETTGCEPMLDVIVYKKLVGGGLMKMPNNAVKPALEALGYSNDEVTALRAAVENTGELVGLQDQHKHVFQTAIGFDQVSAQGHLLMMAAIQPFISGGISKTVNMPASTTAEQIADIYLQAWALGLKCVAVFRDGCKLSQPAGSKVTEKGKAAPVTEMAPPAPAYAGLKWGERKRLPDERPGITHKATVGGQDAYFHVGLYDDGKPGEVFIDIAKAGSTLHGIMDMSSMLLSVGLQHGVPLEVFVDKLKDLKFEPDGITRNRQIPFASSIPDYLGKWMEKRFIEEPLSPLMMMVGVDPNVETVETTVVSVTKTSTAKDRSGPPCKQCGSFTIRSGSCWCCSTCGSTSGCG